MKFLGMFLVVLSFVSVAYATDKPATTYHCCKCNSTLDCSKTTSTKACTCTCESAAECMKNRPR